MTDRLLIDTNVLVYAVDSAEGRRSAIATALLEGASDVKRGVITPQVISEFLSTTERRKLLDRRRATTWALLWLAHLDCVPITATVSEIMLAATLRYQLSVYDAQLWATTKHHEIAVIVTEDLPGGRTELEGVRYVNPFEASFKLEDLGL